MIGFKGRQFDRSVIPLCVRWYLAYGLSLRNLEEMMAERGIAVDHATVHRWVVRYSSALLELFNLRKRAVGGKWHMGRRHGRVLVQRASGFGSGQALPDPGARASWPARARCHRREPNQPGSHPFV